MKLKILNCLKDSMSLLCLYHDDAPSPTVKICSNTRTHTCARTYTQTSGRCQQNTPGAHSTGMQMRPFCISNLLNCTALGLCVCGCEGSVLRLKSSWWRSADITLIFPHSALRIRHTELQHSHTHSVHTLFPFRSARLVQDAPAQKHSHWLPAHCGRSTWGGLWLFLSLTELKQRTEKLITVQTEERRAQSGRRREKL